MKYECHLGGFTHWCEAATHIQAGLITLDECMKQGHLKEGDWGNLPNLPFYVINLDTGYEVEEVTLQEIIWYKYQASQDLPTRFPSKEAEDAFHNEWMEQIKEEIGT